MGDIIITIKIHDAFSESIVRNDKPLINDLTLALSELELIKMQILTDINKLRKKKDVPM